MVQLRTKRTELILYGVLLVLPTLVLAGLHWHQLLSDHRSQLEDVPRETVDAAWRLRDAMVLRVDELIERENQRPFYHYKEAYFPEGTIGTELAFVPSPLVSDKPGEGILAWFCYDFAHELDAELQLFAGSRTQNKEWLKQFEELRDRGRALIAHDWEDGFLRRIARMPGLQSRELPVSVAAINQSPEQDIDCLRAELPALRLLEDEEITINVYGFHLRFYLDDGGVPRILATRRVLINPNTKLLQMPSCFDSLGYGATLVQGFFIDPTWLFGELPMSVAEQVLDASYRFIPPGADPEEELGVSVVDINIVRDLGMETYSPRDEVFGSMKIAMDSRDLEARFRSQVLRLLGVSAMLLISLATGMFLLLGSVRRDLEQAHRTQNFVSAVTHELRTPISAIRLYGEMLRDGWTTEAGKRNEYYRRIVREAGRLETTVERVLEKGRITSTEVQLEVGDLNAALRTVIGDLRQVEPNLDVELASGLAPVYLQPEGLRSIVTNLVENARKYAIDGHQGNGADAEQRILMTTRLRKRQVVLEVADRGPGIPVEERAKIFDAFYRIGNEATRTSQGTGLGLHLVAQQARLMQGRVQALDRKGGGSLFRVTFKAARSEAGKPEELEA